MKLVWRWTTCGRSGIRSGATAARLQGPDGVSNRRVTVNVIIYYILNTCVKLMLEPDVVNY